MESLIIGTGGELPPVAVPARPRATDDDFGLLSFANADAAFSP